MIHWVRIFLFVLLVAVGFVCRILNLKQWLHMKQNYFSVFVSHVTTDGSYM